MNLIHLCTVECPCKHQPSTLPSVLQRKVVRQNTPPPLQKYKGISSSIIWELFTIPSFLQKACEKFCNQAICLKLAFLKLTWLWNPFVNNHLLISEHSWGKADRGQVVMSQKDFSPSSLPLPFYLLGSNPSWWGIAFLSSHSLVIIGKQLVPGRRRSQPLKYRI